MPWLFALVCGASRLAADPEQCISRRSPYRDFLVTLPDLELAINGVFTVADCPKSTALIASKHIRRKKLPSTHSLCRLVIRLQVVH